MEQCLKQGKVIGTIARQKIFITILLMQIWIRMVITDMEINFMEHHSTEPLSFIQHLLIETAKCKAQFSVTQKSYSRPISSWIAGLG